MKKSLFKIITLSSSLLFPALTIAGCGNNCEHQKGEFIDFYIGDESSVYLPAQYKCKVCGKTYLDQITSKDINMPILDIKGDLTGISKDNKVKVKCSYQDCIRQMNFDYDCTLKWQGTTSLNYSKKNFNIQFFKPGSNYVTKQKVKFNNDWVEQSKYTLKANFIDSSNCRNILSAKIYGDVVHSSSVVDEFTPLQHGGAIDGFPIYLTINGLFQGLYTINTPKEKELFDMSSTEEKHQAFLSSNGWNDSTMFLHTITPEYEKWWEKEFCSTEDNSWIFPSFNNMIDFVINNDGDTFKNNISNYVNLTRTIDYFIYVEYACLMDNWAPNILWVTYDGQHWSPSAYDLDTSFGLSWDGKILHPYYQGTGSIGNLLFSKLYKNFFNEIVARYKELRLSALSFNNFSKSIDNLWNKYNKKIFSSDWQKWIDIPLKSENNISIIKEFIKQRGEYFDKLWQ